MSLRSFSTRAQMTTLLALSLASALCAWRMHADPIPLTQDWTRYLHRLAEEKGLAVVGLEDVRRIVAAQSHVLLDARRHADYVLGHLPGAFALPEAELDLFLPQVLPLLTPGQPLLVYCSGDQCDESVRLCDKLRQNGFTNLVLFAGGYKAWTGAGLATEDGG